MINFFSFIKETPDLVFWATALFGTTLFFLRLCATIIGGTTDDMTEIDHTFGDDGEMHHSSTGSFKLFTVHSISGFFMMFGWVGLACIKQLGYSHPVSIVTALIAGTITMVLTGLIFKGAMLLVSSGTHFDIKKTVGLVGTVYQRIPHNGQGKIQLVVDGVTREVLAQSLDQCAIDSFRLVKVIKFLDHEIVVVQEINS
ncbi:hypothetical protein JST56_02895 [Candidatus Dependentiae bacterium]|nr:hypothetical protein [Candidatus Dependentiae bacterium]